MTLHIEIDRDKPGQLTRALQLHRGRWPFHCHYTDATRALKRLTSRATWLFVQQLVQVNTETDEFCITGRFFKGKYNSDHWIPSQMTSNAESVSIS